MSDAAFAPRARVAAREILVVDDRPSNLALIGRRLTQLGYRSVGSPGGTEALARLGRRGFDLVLLDGAMPGLSGVETVRAIRALGAGGVMPVLMMIDRGREADAEAALAAGADDVILKPFAAETLGIAIERLFARRRMIAALGRERAG